MPAESCHRRSRPPGRPDSRYRAWLAPALLVLLLGSGVASRSFAADYQVMPAVQDLGGGRTGSADHRVDQSFGFGGLAVGPGPGGLVLRLGYGGQFNDPPVPAAKVVERRADAPAKILRTTLRDGATDPESDATFLRDVTMTTSAGVVLAQDGDWLLYQPPPGLLEDRIRYTLVDAWGEVARGEVVVRVAEPTAPTRNILAIELLGDGRGTRILWVGIPGRFYRVQATDQLMPPVTWVTLGTVRAGANGRYEYIDGLAPSGLRFYRAITP